MTNQTRIISATEKIEFAKSQIILIRQKQVDLSRDTSKLDHYGLKKLIKRLKTMNRQCGHYIGQINRLQKAQA